MPILLDGELDPEKWTDPDPGFKPVPMHCAIRSFPFWEDLLAEHADIRAWYMLYLGRTQDDHLSHDAAVIRARGNKKVFKQALKALHRRVRDAKQLAVKQQVLSKLVMWHKA